MAQNNGILPFPKVVYDIPTSIQKTDSTHSSKIVYCSNWKPDTRFEVGDYFYFKDNYEYYYKCVTAGITSSLSHAKSGYYEPVWSFIRSVYDERIIWEAIKVSDIPRPESIRKWTPRTSYALGGYVYPSDGKPLILDGIEYAFRYTNTVPYPKWPKEPNKVVEDGTVVWECCLSIGRLLPRERRKEEAFIELIKCLDYLQLHEELHFSDIRNKFGDRHKIRDIAVKQVIGEYGYAYITNTMQLGKEEIRYLASYLSLISALKGGKNGLEMCLELLGMSYRYEEWWEPVKDEDKGEPDTWNLYLELDIAKATAHLVKRIVNFTRNYVYPVLDKFQITYFVNMAEIGIVSGGFIERIYEWDLDTGIFVLGSCGGFIEKNYLFYCMYRPDFSSVIISGGYILKDYYFEISIYVPKVLAPDNGENRAIGAEREPESTRWIELANADFEEVYAPSIIGPVANSILDYRQPFTVVGSEFVSTNPDAIPAFTEVRITTAKDRPIWYSGLLPFSRTVEVPILPEDVDTNSVITIKLKYSSLMYSSPWAQIKCFYGRSVYIEKPTVSVEQKITEAEAEYIYVRVSSPVSIPSTKVITDVMAIVRISNETGEVYKEEKIAIEDYTNVYLELPITNRTDTISVKYEAKCNKEDVTSTFSNSVSLQI